MPVMKISWSRLCWLFLIGAIVSPLGDHGHITTGTTAYLSRATPFVGDSPLWFLVMVGISTAGLADLRLRLGAPRPNVTWRDGVVALAAMLAVYAVTALLRHQPIVPATVLVVALAALVAGTLGDRAGILCGVAAGVGGVVVEALLIKAGLFKYADEIALLFGVAPWTPALYFCFGVVGARLGEVAAATATPE
jgi:hypothetical protein